MKYKRRKIDHIVYSVLDLEAAIDDIENQLGVRPSIGGRHLNKGTKNALLNLGKGCYLEILAIDEENTEVKTPRWMGIDLIKKACITRWALKSNEILKDQRILRGYKTELGEIFEGERLTTNDSILKWKMTLPQAHPRVELAPFMVDWSDSKAHPTTNLKEECSLEQINFKAPKNNLKIRNCFKEIFNENTIRGSAIEQISIIIKGPKGLLKL